MKYFYLVLVVLAVYAAYAYGRIVYVAGQANLPKIVQKDATLGAGPTLKYFALGDSTAFGEGASDREHTYAWKIAQKLAETRTVTYRNMAVTGASTRDVLEGQVAHAIDFQPDVITLSVGANDRTHLWPNDRILANLKKIIGQLEGNTTAQIYVTDIPNFTGATLLPAWYITFLEGRTATLNFQIQALENERVKIVNIHDFGWAKFPDITATYAADQFHPNDLGYQNWTDAFLSRISL